jgi:hypothetical protein
VGGSLDFLLQSFPGLLRSSRQLQAKWAVECGRAQESGRSTRRRRARGRERARARAPGGGGWAGAGTLAQDGRTAGARVASCESRREADGAGRRSSPPLFALVNGPVRYFGPNIKRGFRITWATMTRWIIVKLSPIFYIYIYFSDFSKKYISHFKFCKSIPLLP